MIFYSFFPERWLSATDRLTMVEECAYLRLVNWQYRNECDLPTDADECCRIARAATAAERAAVSRVLELFYVEGDAGFHQARVTHEVSRFQAGEPERTARREANTARKARSRAVLQGLYALAKAHGVAARGGKSIADMRELLSARGIELGALGEVERWQPMAERHASMSATTNGGAHTSVSDEGFSVVTEVVTEHVTEVSHKEVSQSSIPITHNSLCDSDESHAARVRATPAGEACKAMRGSGLVGVNPSHPVLLRLLDAGCTVDHLAVAAAQAVSKGKGFAYALAIAQGQMADAAALPALSPRQSEAARFIADAAPELLDPRFQSAQH